MHFFYNLQSPNPKKISNRESKILFLKENLLIRLFDLNLQEFQKSIFKKLQYNTFGKLSNLHLLRFVTR